MAQDPVSTAYKCACNCTATRALLDDNACKPDTYDKEIWNLVCNLYPDGLIDLISPQIPNVPAWFSKLYSHIQTRRGVYKKEASKNPCFPSHEFDISYSVNFSDLQRPYMRYLQAKLVDFAVANKFDDDKGLGMLQEFSVTMKDYVQAVRDHEYMKEFLEQPSDPFIVSGSRFHDRILLENSILPELRHGVAAAFLPEFQDPTRATQKGGNAAFTPRSQLEDLIAAAVPTGPWERQSLNGKRVQAVGDTRVNSMKTAFSSRLIGSIMGGAFLVAPMWLLVLVKNQWIHLGVTTGCVFAFGLLASWFLKNLEGVFAATFAYAAVLMVFVGVMMQES